MTFSFLPHRSLSDDDALDRQLNDWVAGIDIQLGSETAADALEFHRWASSTLGSDSAATGPVAGTWNRVLRNSAQASSKGNSTMSTATLSSPATGNTLVPPQTLRERTSRFANLAATVALVMAVAIGGWLAMSQMPDGGGRFAATQATPDDASQICDVEPLTVDEVMEMVRNPYRYLYDRADVEDRKHNSYALIAGEELAVGNPIPNRWEADLVNRTTPSQADFDRAIAIVDQYVGCAQGATYGQYWALVHPIWVQSSILANFPVFADEQSVRALVEQTIDEPVASRSNGLGTYHDVYGGVTMTANPQLEMAEEILWSTTSEPIIVLGVRVTDANGEVIMETTSTGYANEIQPGGLTLRPVVAVQLSSLTGEWYVVPWLGQFS